MARNLFARDELVLCTYAALFDGDDIGGCEAISGLSGRPSSSISKKIRNIAVTLDSKGYVRQSTVQGLSGRTTGETARETAWDIIQPLTLLSRNGLLEKCQHILETNGCSNPRQNSAEQLEAAYKAAMDRMASLEKRMNDMRAR